MPEVLEGSGAGDLVPPGRPDLLAAGLITILSDATLRDRMASAARARARQFDIRTSVAELERIYDRVLAGD